MLRTFATGGDGRNGDGAGPRFRLRFHPYIRAALHLDDQPLPPLHEAVLDNLLMLAAARRSPETT